MINKKNKILKLNENEIRYVIKKLLEASNSPSELALIEIPGSESDNPIVDEIAVSLVVVDSKELMDSVDNLSNNWVKTGRDVNDFGKIFSRNIGQELLSDLFRDSIVAGIVLSNPESSNKCEGAMAVVSSFSTGKLRGRDLYNMAATWAMQHGAPIMPDRLSVSSDARRIWKYWDSKSSGYPSWPNNKDNKRDRGFARPIFDDEKNPVTPQKRDDCAFHTLFPGMEEEDAYLNRAYGPAADDGGLANLLPRGKKLISDISKKHKININDLLICLYNARADEFIEHYENYLNREDKKTKLK